MQIKGKEKTQKPVLLALLQRADVFLARPTHLSLTPRKETRKSAVHQLARTHTQEGP